MDEEVGRESGIYAAFHCLFLLLLSVLLMHADTAIQHHCQVPSVYRLYPAAAHRLSVTLPSSGLLAGPAFGRDRCLVSTARENRSVVHANLISVPASCAYSSTAPEVNYIDREQYLRVLLFNEQRRAVSNTTNNTNNIHPHNNRHCSMASMISTRRGFEDSHNHGRFIGMFSYGSNNEQQLRARVDSPQLRCGTGSVWCIRPERDTRKQQYCTAVFTSNA